MACHGTSHPSEILVEVEGVVEGPAHQKKKDITYWLEPTANHSELERK